MFAIYVCDLCLFGCLQVVILVVICWKFQCVEFEEGVSHEMEPDRCLCRARAKQAGGAPSVLSWKRRGGQA